MAPVHIHMEARTRGRDAAWWAIVISLRTCLLVGTIACLLISGVGSIAAQSGSIDALGSPELDTYAPNNDLTPGSEETLTVQVANEGNLQRGSAQDRQYVTTARDVSVALRAGSAPITVETERQTIGELSVSDVATPSFDLTIPESASPGRYTLTVSIDYSYTSKARDAPTLRAQTSESSRSIERTIAVVVTDDARFEVTEVDSKLYIGEEGQIAGRVKNIGGSDANNAEIKFSPSNENINALSSSVAVGDIPVGESAPFSIPVEVTSGAQAVPHRFDLDVNYRDESSISQNTNDPEFLVEISPNRDSFLVKPVNSSISAGGSRPLRVRVTNNLNETVTDIEGKFFADSPLDSTSDETFTGSLNPGETTTVTVDLSASGGATVKNYPASIDFRYVDSEGDSKLTDSYRMAISVTEPEESGGSPLPLVIGLLVVAAGGFFAWRRGLFERFTG